VKTFRVYVDTSVIGGCQDDEFAEDSLRLSEAARYGRLVLLISAVVTRELASAPPSVLNVLVELPKGAAENVALTREVIELRDAHVAEKILS
jgi:hypothetical protein